ncbi:MAG: hypothetical protein ACM3PT_01195 [Deltaproteobacteria bacterium]
MSRQVDISLLIKISEEKYIDEIQRKGKFYCNSLKYFRDLENNSYKADPNEGRQYIKQAKNLEIFLGDKKIGHSSNAQLFPDKFDEGNVFCFYGLLTSKLDLKTKQLQKIDIEIESDRLGQHALIILDLPELMKRIEDKFAELKMDFQISLVEYLNFSEYEGELSPFTKSHIYESQSEVRIWIPRKEEGPFIFYIGDISDISYKCKIEDLNKLEAEILK